MAFTIGSGTFTNGSATVTGVTLTSGTLAYFASGTRMVVGVNPVVQEVEAIAAPTVTTITLRSAWTGTGGTYSFLANQTSEGLRDAVQAIRTNNVSLQSFIDSIDTAATANSVAQRTSNGSLNAVSVYATGNVGVGVSSVTPATGFSKLEIGGAAGSQALLSSTSANASARNYAIASNFNAFGDFGIVRSNARLGDPVSAGTPVLYANLSGNVGIGTSSPVGRLEVHSEGGSHFRAVVTSQPTYFTEYTTNGISYNGSNQNFRFTDNGTERMQIDSSGNVLVGTTSGSSHTFSKNSYQPVVYVKDVNPDNTGSRIGMAIDVGTFDSPDSSSVFISLRRRDSTQVGSIMRSGTDSVSYNTSSDYRLKEDWQPMEGSIDRLMQLKPCNFAWKADGSRVDGFLAHEAQEVVPEAVHGEKDAVRIQQYEVSPAVYEDVVIPAELDEEGNEISPERTEQKLVSEAVMGEREVPEYQGIDQSKIVPLLTAALQDAVKEIEALKARIEALEG